MPDWQALLRARLGPLRLSPQGQAEVIAELAAHFEDEHRARLDAGAPPDQVVHSTLAQVRDWKRFRRDLESNKEDPMNQRVRALWLPGLFACLFCFSLLAVMIRAGLRPRFIWLAPAMGVAFYVPWFVALILVGALAAWWSRRAGGAVRERLQAALLPSVSMIVLFTLLFFVSLVFERHHSPGWMVVAWLVMLLAWAILPGVGLLLGALPFLGAAPAVRRQAVSAGN